MLGKRVITALILLPLVLAGIFRLDNGHFALVLGFIVLLGMDEWSRLIGLHQPLARLGFVFLGLLAMLLAWSSPEGLSAILYAAAMWWLFALLAVIGYPRLVGIWYGHLGLRIFAGLLVLVPSFIALVKLQGMAQGPFWVVLLMLLIWGADSGAYFSGRQWGRRKLAPKVSPGKSWEGVIGGAVTALILVFVAQHYMPVSLIPSVATLIFILIVVAISVLGDLLESLYKRQAGVKDSGKLLPGHGGVLDRIDSLTAAAPIFLLGLQLLGLA